MVAVQQSDVSSSESSANNNNLSLSVNFRSHYDTLLPKIRGFKMVFLNTASVPAHIDELRILFHDQTIDVIAFNETRLASYISSKQMKIKGYELVRCDRNCDGGGACIYLRDTINFIDKKDLVPQDLEAVCVEITRRNTKPFLVTTIYRPPDSPSEYFDKCEELITNIDSLDKEFYVLGDLNCSWLKEYKYETKRLKAFCDLYQLTQLIKEPTRITETSSSLLDVIITSHPERIVHSGVRHIGVSDHSLIYAIKKSNVTSPQKPKIIKTRNFRNFDNNDFLWDLSGQPWSNLQYCHNIEQMWSLWKSMFITIVDKHAPIKRKRIRSSSIPWVTPEIKQLIFERDKIKHKHAITKNRELWDDYKRLRNKVNKAIKNKKCHYYQHKIEVNKDNPKGTWRILNSLMGRTPNNKSINEIKVNGNSVSSPGEIAECFNNFFVEVGPKLASCMDHSCDHNFRDYIPTAANHFAFTTTNYTKVLKVIERLSSTKATGLDEISAKMLKHAAPVITESLTFVFIASSTLVFFQLNGKKLGSVHCSKMVPEVKLIITDLYRFSQ